MATPVLSFRVEEELVRRLDHLAQATDRDRQYHLKRALARYIDSEAWQVAAIAEGVAQADAGNLTNLDTVKAKWVGRAKKDRPDQ